jgi:hypothetical protein
MKIRGAAIMAALIAIASGWLFARRSPPAVTITFTGFRNDGMAYFSVTNVSETKFRYWFGIVRFTNGVASAPTPSFASPYWSDLYLQKVESFRVEAPFRPCTWAGRLYLWDPNSLREKFNRSLRKVGIRKQLEPKFEIISSRPTTNYYDYFNEPK